jgi:hypothetical protein
MLFEHILKNIVYRQNKSITMQIEYRLRIYFCLRPWFKVNNIISNARSISRIIEAPTTRLA